MSLINFSFTQTYNVCSYQDISYMVSVTDEDRNETVVANEASINITTSVSDLLTRSSTTAIFIDIIELFPGATTGYYSFVVTANSVNKTKPVYILRNISK